MCCTLPKFRADSLGALVLKKAEPQAWNLQNAPTEAFFYQLMLDGLAQRSPNPPPPLPQYDQPLVRFLHATRPRGIAGILTEARVRPSASQYPQSQSFFGIGHKVEHDSVWNASSFGRCLYSANKMHKNSSALLAVGVAYGPYSTQKFGGEQLAMDKTVGGGVVNYGGVLVISCKTHQVTSLAWSVDAKPPDLG